MKKNLNLCGGLSSVVAAGVALSLVAPVGVGNVQAAPVITEKDVKDATEISSGIKANVTIPGAGTRVKGYAKFTVPSSGWVNLSFDYTELVCYNVYIYDSDFNYLTDMVIKSNSQTDRKGSASFEKVIMREGTYYLYFLAGDGNSGNWKNGSCFGANIDISYSFENVDYMSELDINDNDSIDKAVEIPFDSNNTASVSGLSEWYTFNTFDKDDYYKVTVTSGGSYDLKATASKGITVSLYDASAKKLNSYGGVIKKSVNETVSLSKGVYYIDLASGTNSNTYDFSLSLKTAETGTGSTEGGSGTGTGTGTGESGSGTGTGTGTGSGESGSGSGTGTGESGSGSGTGTVTGESGSGTGTGTGESGSGTGTGSGESGSGSGTGTGSGTTGENKGSASTDDNKTGGAGTTGSNVTNPDTSSKTNTTDSSSAKNNTDSNVSGVTEKPTNNNTSGSNTSSSNATSSNTSGGNTSSSNTSKNNVSSNGTSSNNTSDSSASGNKTNNNVSSNTTSKNSESSNTTSKNNTVNSDATTNNTANNNVATNNDSNNNTSTSSSKDTTPAAIPQTEKYSSEWVNGKWYNADGSQTYEPILEWKSDSTGWWVEDSNGWYPTSSWQKIDGYWYYFKSNGYMAAGEYYDGYWFNSDGTWDDTYLLSWKSNSTGWWVEDISGWWPSSSWLKINDSWYYFDGSGYMVTDQYVDGYWLGSDGACW